MAFSLYERQYLGIHGMLPPAFMTEEQQAYRIISKLREQPDDLARYIQLDGLQARKLIFPEKPFLMSTFTFTCKEGNIHEWRFFYVNNKFFATHSGFCELNERCY